MNNPSENKTPRVLDTSALVHDPKSLLAYREDVYICLTVLEELDNLKERTPVYFVHSYIASPRDPNCIIASCSYGGIEIPSIVGQGNVLGCQFHPEKSHTAGLTLLKNFLRWDGTCS